MCSVRPFRRSQACYYSTWGINQFGCAHSPPISRLSLVSFSSNSIRFGLWFIELLIYWIIDWFMNLYIDVLIDVLISPFTYSLKYRFTIVFIHSSIAWYIDLWSPILPVPKNHQKIAPSRIFRKTNYVLGLPSFSMFAGLGRHSAYQVSIC